MATGTIQSSVYATHPWILARTANRAAMMFSPFGKPRKDVGYVTRPKKTVVFMANGTAADGALTRIVGNDDADGILWNVTPPAVVAAYSSLRIVLTVSDEGPLEYEAVLTFETTCASWPTMTFVGTRAWKLPGDTGYLFFRHNWENGFDETLSWKTEVLTAHDRTEQRIRWRTIPRREVNLELIVSGDARRMLDQWLAQRMTRNLFVPVWRDVSGIISAVEGEDRVIPVVTAGYDYEVGRYVALWDGGDTREIRRISGIGPEYLAVDTPLAFAWPKGSWIAPCRFCRANDARRRSRFTEDVEVYRFSVTLLNETLTPVLENPELYRSIMVCPFTPSWVPGSNEDVANHWISLDNDTGVLQYDIRSIEPIFSRDVSFVLFGRQRIDLFLRFLSACAGRLAPFWMASPGREFELAAPAFQDQNFIIITNIDYEFSLSGSPARSHIELVTTDGTVIRRMITGVETRPDRTEKLYLDSVLGRPITSDGLNRCAWLEKVRLDSDEINLHWVSGDCVTVTLPLVVLP